MSHKKTRPLGHPASPTPPDPLDPARSRVTSTQSGMLRSKRMVDLRMSLGIGPRGVLNPVPFNPLGPTIVNTPRRKNAPRYSPKR